MFDLQKCDFHHNRIDKGITRHFKYFKVYKVYRLLETFCKFLKALEFLTMEVKWTDMDKVFKNIVIQSVQSSVDW